MLTGLAVSDDGLHFTRVRETPILERSHSELYFRCGPFVQRERHTYRMWYIAGSDWTDVGGKEVPIYDLRYAESGDGIQWPAHGRVVLSISGDNEHGFGRPWVVQTEAGWELFYSVRCKSLRAYRMGYAKSADGEIWHRCDPEFGLGPSADGWDSEAVCYGAPLIINGRMWLFYNGNNFGETGFGVAVREE